MNRSSFIDKEAVACSLIWVHAHTWVVCSLCCWKALRLMFRKYLISRLNKSKKSILIFLCSWLLEKVLSATGKWQSWPILRREKLHSRIFPELLNLLPRYSRSQSVLKRHSVCVYSGLYANSKGGQTAGLMAEEEKKGLSINGKLAASVVKINYLSSSPLSISPDMMTQDEGKKTSMSTLAAVCFDQINLFFPFVLMPDYKMISQRACLPPTLHPPHGLTDSWCDTLLALFKLSTTVKHTHTHTNTVLQW